MKKNKNKDVKVRRKVVFWIINLRFLRLGFIKAQIGCLIILLSRLLMIFMKNKLAFCVIIRLKIYLR